MIKNRLKQLKDDKENLSTIVVATAIELRYALIILSYAGDISVEL